MACSFPAVPRGRARKPHGKKPWLQEEAALPPRQRFWYSQTCCVFCLKMNSYEEYHGSISQCCPRRIFPEQGACSWPCGWKWVFLGITGPLEYHTALWPLTPPLCGCYFPPQNRNYSIFSNKVFLLLSEISPCCPGSCLTLK